MFADLPLAFLVSSSTVGQVLGRVFDDSFAGVHGISLHRLAWFDWALLIPYFTVLFVLSIYGMHRYEMIRAYFKHRRKMIVEPPQRFERLPRVTIQLPLYNERYV